ncbi:MAG TPA: transglycosylase SLT domain-containing protein [Pyrinomonadaceae bacterium]|nr:transglycosylase SLT domain-containing protein [Pyrinomonadaceae bacterium]
MTRKKSPHASSVLSGAAVVLCAGFISVVAQETRPNNAARSASEAHSTQPAGVRNPAVRLAAKRPGNRRLVKIRTRAGDTLSLLGDRFGASPEEIAALNGINAPLEPGREILIPLPSPEMLARASAEKMAQQRGDNPSDISGLAAVEAEDAWENVQGVMFRKGNAARSVSRARTEIAAGSETESGSTAPGGATLAKVVEVSDAERSAAPHPVWIYLVGGARVEADSVNETTEGVWYTHGSLTIFIERSRIERIERERAPEVSDNSRSWTERGWTTGNPKFDALIRENGARYDVDPYLIFCVMEQESQFKPWVVSPKGARGLMQLMPGTAAHFGVRRPLDPAENIMGGTKYLKQLLGNFNGRVDLVLAGYNAGEGAVMKYGGNVPPYKETRNYVQRISKRYGQNRPTPSADLPAVASKLK